LALSWGWGIILQAFFIHFLTDTAPTSGAGLLQSSLIVTSTSVPAVISLAHKTPDEPAPASKRVFMVGILIVTHGDLGVILAQCAQHILQRELPNLAVMAVDKNDDPDRKLAEARDLVRGLDDGSGVLLLSDIFGGTPSNIASRLIEPGRVEAVAGVSLPMLVRSLCYAGQPLETVVSKAVTGGLEGVMYIVPGDAHGASAS